MKRRFILTTGVLTGLGMLHGASENVVGIAEIKETLADLAVRQKNINQKLDNFKEISEQQNTSFSTLKEKYELLQNNLETLHIKERLESIEEKMLMLDTLLENVMKKIKQMSDFFNDENESETITIKPQSQDTVVYSNQQTDKKKSLNFLMQSYEYLKKELKALEKDLQECGCMNMK